MLKYRKKLSFSILFLILFSNILFTQGIFLKNNSNFTISSSVNYSKHKDLRNYKYGLTFGIVKSGNLQVHFNYSKINKYQNSLYENSIWEEYYSTSISYFIKPNSPIRFGLSTEASYPIRDSSPISSFSFILNGRFLGSKGTGMTFYPYIKYEIKYKANYETAIHSFLKSENDIDNYNEIRIGCVMTFNDLWITPFYEKNKDTNSIYEGIEIGLWDYKISNN